jgi:hypothetical protein
MGARRSRPQHFLTASELGRIHVRDEIADLVGRLSRRSGVLFDALRARTRVDAVRPHKNGPPSAHGRLLVVTKRWCVERAVWSLEPLPE